MAPTICAGKKTETRILNNDAKRRKRYSSNNLTRFYDILREQSGTTTSSNNMNLNIATNIVNNNSLPLNLTCNKLINISENMIIHGMNESDDATEHLHITNNNTNYNCGEIIKNTINTSSLPLMMISSLSSLPLTNHNIRYPSINASTSDISSSPSDNNDIDPYDYDNDNDDDNDVDDNTDDNDDTDDDINDDGDENILKSNIDEKKRLFYNTIISGNFNEHDSDNKNMNSCRDKHKNQNTTDLSDKENLIFPSSNRPHSTDDLLSIAVKTVKLVKRNQLLQQRLNQLQLETTAFIESVLSNPENRHFRDKVLQKVDNITNI